MTTLLYITSEWEKYEQKNYYHPTNNYNIFLNRFKKMLQKNYQWGDLKLTNNPNVAEYFIIYNVPDLDKIKSIDLKRSILIQTEPQCFINQFPTPFNCPRSEDFLFIYDLSNYRTLIEWQIPQTYESLLDHPIKNSNQLTAVISERNDLKMHKVRLNFLSFLKQNNFNILRYGERNHRINDKSKVMLPFKYHLAVENSIQENYWTEKFIDPLLCECLTFYHGCPNISKWINPNSFITIDVNDKQKALSIIIQSIYNKEWEKRIDIIREEKQYYLQNLSFFATIEKIILKIKHPKKNLKVL